MLLKRNRPTFPRLSGVGVALTTLLLPGVAEAHVGFHAHFSFADGFIHPLTGADHLAAMLAVGLIATRYGSVTWKLPVVFVTTMFCGFLAGLGHPSAIVESGISVSLVFLFLWLALGKRIPLKIGLYAAGVFGTLHGWAHGGETSLASGGLQFLAGAVLATAILHTFGLAIGCLVSGRFFQGRIARGLADKAANLRRSFRKEGAT